MGRLIATSFMFACLTAAAPAWAEAPEEARIAPPPPWTKDVGVNGLVPARDPNWAGGYPNVWSPNAAGYKDCQAAGGSVMKQLKMVAADWKTLTRLDRDYPEVKAYNEAHGYAPNDNRATALQNQDAFRKYRTWHDFRCVEIYRQVTAEPIDTNIWRTYTNNIYLQGFTPYGGKLGLRGLPSGLNPDGSGYQLAAQKGAPVDAAKSITPAGVWAVTTNGGDRYTLTVCDKTSFVSAYNTPLSGTITGGRGGSGTFTGNYMPGWIRIDYTLAGSTSFVVLQYYADELWGGNPSAGVTWTGTRPRLSGLTPPSPSSCSSTPTSTNASPLMLLGNWRIATGSGQNLDMTIVPPQNFRPGFSIPGQIQAPLVSDDGKRQDGTISGLLDLNAGIFQFTYVLTSGEAGAGVISMGSDASSLNVSGSSTVSGATSALTWTVTRRP